MRRLLALLLSLSLALTGFTGAAKAEKDRRFTNRDLAWEPANSQERNSTQSKIPVEAAIFRPAVTINAAPSRLSPGRRILWDYSIFKISSRIRLAQSRTCCLLTRPSATASRTVSG